MTTKTLTKNKKQQSQQEPHEVIINDAPHEHQTWEPGDVAHQGDVIFVCLRRLPVTAKLREHRQLADGNTQGSRHILDGGECYSGDVTDLRGLIKKDTGMDVGEAYIGPVFTTPAKVLHPEHGDHIFPHESVTACVYQRSLDAEDREQRVLD